MTRLTIRASLILTVPPRPEGIRSGEIFIAKEICARC